jgi:hypothetical protein
MMPAVLAADKRITLLHLRLPWWAETGFIHACNARLGPNLRLMTQIHMHNELLCMPPHT